LGPLATFQKLKQDAETNVQKYDKLIFWMVKKFEYFGKSICT
jgi:hypothetical protein